MSQSPDSRFPPGYSHATGKGDILIPGAGTFVMAVLLVSLSILFAASMLAFIVIRHRAVQWPPAGFPALPRSLWLSTIIILFASVAVQRAVAAVRRDDQKRLVRALLATLAIGGLFLLLQTFNWIDFYLAFKDRVQFEGPYLGMFYVLTGLHAAHVIGGLIPLAIVLARAKSGRYSRNFHPGVRYCALYWHFLDIIWLILFTLIYF